MAGECGKFIISWRLSETSSEPKEPDLLISSFLRPKQAEGNQPKTQKCHIPHLCWAGERGSVASPHFSAGKVPLAPLYGPSAAQAGAGQGSAC